MATVHILKNTNQRAVVKVYNDNGPATVDVSFASLLKGDEENIGTYKAHIRALYWGVKNSHDVTVGRYNGTNIEGETFLTGAGEVEYFGAGFTDNTYETLPVQVIFSGAGSVILDITKVDGYKTKIETGAFSVYDDETKVGE